MITAYAISMLVFSASLTCLALLVLATSRRFLRADPIAAHRFALLALGCVLVALPARFLVGAGEDKAAPESEPMRLGAEARTEEVGDGLLVEEIQALRVRIAETRQALGERGETEAVDLRTDGDPDHQVAEPALPASAVPQRSPEAVARPGRLAQLTIAVSGKLEGHTTRSIIVGILLLHLCGALLVAGRRLARLSATRAMVARAEAADSGDLRRLWRRIAGTRAGRTRLLVSDEIDSPACFGVLDPVLILPQSALDRCDRGALAWALKHELVHIRRGDCLISPLQHLMVALAWFHPAAWWLERELVRLRELSCDRQVVNDNGGRKSYALALIDFARERGSRAGHAAPMDAPALIPWSGGKTFLQRRIEMLAHGSDSTSSWARGLRLGTLTAACLGLWLVDLGFAAAIPRPQEPPAGGVVIIEEAVAAEPIEEEEMILDEPEADEEIIDEERTAHQDQTPRLGIMLKDVDETLAAQLGIDQGSAIVVDNVTENSAAAKAGLMKHDVIVRINGKPGSLVNLQAERDKSAGKAPLEIEIRRRARRMVVVVWGKQGQSQGFFGSDAEAARPIAPRGSRDRVLSPSDESDYRAELDRLKLQLAQLEKRLNRNADGEAPGPRAPARRNLRRDDFLESSANEATPEARERARAMELRKRELAAQIDSLANDRDVLVTELRNMKAVRDQVEDEKERQQIDSRITRLEVKLDELERIIDKMNAGLKSDEEQPRRVRRADPRRANLERSAAEAQLRIQELHAMAAQVQEIGAESNRVSKQLAEAQRQLTDLTVNKGWTDQAPEVPELRAHIAELENVLARLDAKKEVLHQALDRQKESIKERSAPRAPASPRAGGGGVK